jgi:histidyl-tRNA synthetase
LVETLGGKPTPGVGFACGIEPLLLAMEKEGVVWKDENRLKVFIATLGEEAKRSGFKLGQELRHQGFSCEMDFLARSLKAQMREADRLKARFVLILGDEEIRKRVVMLRDMATKEQREVTREAAVAILTEHFVHIAH